MNASCVKMTILPQLHHLKKEGPSGQQLQEQDVSDGSRTPSRNEPEKRQEEPGQKRRMRTSPHRHRKRALQSSSASLGQPGPSSRESPPPLNSQEDFSGYNSGDEYDRPDDSWSEQELLERERRFEVGLRKKGYNIKKMDEDGACLFRAVADQVYGDQDMHGVLRKLCMDYMTKNSDYFSQYVTEPFDKYVERKRHEKAHGNHIEMQALSEMFNRPIEVYHYSQEPINIFTGMHKTDNDPIRLSYHRNVHYNSIVDPFKASIGVGLGFPQLQPGLADKQVLMEAIRASEQTELEKQMLKDKLMASDWEATNEALEQQVAQESYLEYVRENEKRSRKRGQRNGTSSSSQGGESPRGSASPKSGRTSPKVGCSHQGTSTQLKTSPRNSPRLATVKEEVSCSSPQAGSSGATADAKSTTSSSKDFPSIQETASFMNNFPPEMFGLEDYDDSVLARVLAESQEEYFRQMKKQQVSTSSDVNEGASTSMQR